MVLLKISHNSQEKNRTKDSLSIYSCRLKVYNFIEKRLRLKCFPVNFVKISKTHSLQVAAFDLSFKSFLSTRLNTQRLNSIKRSNCKSFEPTKQVQLKSPCTATPVPESLFSLSCRPQPVTLLKKRLWRGTSVFLKIFKNNILYRKWLLLHIA